MGAGALVVDFWDTLTVPSFGRRDQLLGEIGTRLGADRARFVDAYPSFPLMHGKCPRPRSPRRHRSSANAGCEGEHMCDQTMVRGSRPVRNGAQLAYARSLLLVVAIVTAAQELTRSPVSAPPPRFEHP